MSRARIAYLHGPVLELGALACQEDMPTSTLSHSLSIPRIRNSGAAMKCETCSLLPGLRQIPGNHRPAAGRKQFTTLSVQGRRIQHAGGATRQTM